MFYTKETLFWGKTSSTQQDIYKFLNEVGHFFEI